mmetsp:Transcript_102456/g.330556  ORF Transcript_102456/g.330556 Transcript_102456/m.330556 type:complete len:289 (+) Transcript_102456:96-962(+)
MRGGSEDGTSAVSVPCCSRPKSTVQGRHTSRSAAGRVLLRLLVLLLRLPLSRRQQQPRCCSKSRRSQYPQADRAARTLTTARLLRHRHRATYGSTCRRLTRRTIQPWTMLPSSSRSFIAAKRNSASSALDLASTSTSMPPTSCICLVISSGSRWSRPLATWASSTCSRSTRRHRGMRVRSVMRKSTHPTFASPRLSWTILRTSTCSTVTSMTMRLPLWNCFAAVAVTPARALILAGIISSSFTAIFLENLSSETSELASFPSRPPMCGRRSLSCMRMTSCLFLTTMFR